MIPVEQIKAFTEYVVRPLTEDIRVIVEKLKEANLPISEKLIDRTVDSVIYHHIALELIKWVVYVSIVALVCHTVAIIL